MSNKTIHISFMNNILKVLLCLTFPFFLHSCVLAQTEDLDPDSNSFEAILEKSFEELDESNYGEDVQRKYAQVFYRYYLENPNEKYSEWALVHAFKFWGNIGAAEQTKEAMAKLDSNAQFWGDFIEFVPNAYRNSEHKTLEDAVELLEELKGNLTDPMSKSRIYWWLASYYHVREDIENLKRVAREMINLDASEIHITQGLGYLYELESLNIGQEAPHFQGKTVQGEPISVPQNDKIVLLEFWATWCSPCIPEIPHLKSIQAKYSEDDLVIIGISLDTDLENLKQFIQDKDMTWPQIIQPQEWNDDIIKMYNVSGIPRTYIIGKDGKILAKDLRGEELEKEITKLMNQ